MTIKTSIAVLILCMTPFSAMAQKITVSPNQDYQGVENSLTHGGSYKLFAGLHEVKGKVAVCGLVWFGGKMTASTKTLEHKFSKNILYKLDGKVLSVSATNFIRYDTEAEARSANKAGCSVSGRKWSDVKDLKSFELSFPAKVKVYD